MAAAAVLRRLLGSAVLLCLQVAAGQVQKEAAKPVRVAESDVDVSETHVHVSSVLGLRVNALCLPLQVKLSRLCEQDKTLKELEVRISSLKEDKVSPFTPDAAAAPRPSEALVSRAAPPLQDKLEHVLDLSRQQMEQYRDQPVHSQKIAYQQRLLQEDLVALRAQISRVCTVCVHVSV